MTEGKAKEARVGKYVLVRRIAKGGMAELYLANQTDQLGAQKPVVIKRILPSLTQDKSFVRMFLDEARIAAQLSHPNIIRIHDLGKAGDSYYIAMEYVDGMDMEWALSLLKRKGRYIPVDCGAAIAARVAEALQYAHRQTDIEGRPLNIIHRDVTPGNIMVSLQGGVKLVDFGIAKAAAQFERTNPGVVKGKFFYLSPEQTLRLPIDHRSDIFSLGVSLYEMTTGTRPFDAGDPVDILNAIRDLNPPPPTEIVRGYPQALSQIVMKALEKDRLRRYHDAHAMQEALDGFLARSGPPAGSMELASLMREVVEIRSGGGEPATAPHVGAVATDATARLGPARPKAASEDVLRVPFVDDQQTDPARPNARLAVSSPTESEVSLRAISDPEIDEPDAVTRLVVRRPVNLSDSQPFDPFVDDPAGVELVLEGSEQFDDAVTLTPATGPAPAPPASAEGLDFVPSDEHSEHSTQSEVDVPESAVTESPRSRVSLFLLVLMVGALGAIGWREKDRLLALAQGLRGRPADPVPVTEVQPPVAPPAPERPKVHVSIISIPTGASVNFPEDNPPAGTTPLSMDVARGGTLSARLALDGYPTQIRTIDLSADVEVVVAFPERTTPAPPPAPPPTPATGAHEKAGHGHLAVDASPWAKVTLDDGKARREIGTTPFDKEVASGNYTLIAENGPAGLREQRKIKIKPNGTLRLRITFGKSSH